MHKKNDFVRLEGQVIPSPLLSGIRDPNPKLGNPNSKNRFVVVELW
jgi:hypothetical protein